MTTMSSNSSASEVRLIVQLEKLRSSGAKKDRVIKRMKRHQYNLERNIEGRAKAIERYRTREAKLIAALKEIESLNEYYSGGIAYKVLEEIK